MVGSWLVHGWFLVGFLVGSWLVHSWFHGWFVVGLWLVSSWLVRGWFMVGSWLVLIRVRRQHYKGHFMKKQPLKN
jgi:hypothetical protein